MGAGSSSSIKSVKIEQEKLPGSRCDDNNSKTHNSLPTLDATAESQKGTENERPSAITADTSSDQNTTEMAILTQQLTESESQRLDLEDRVQTLEERLEYMSTQTIIAEDKTCDETLHAKDQYIAKLEREKSDIEMANKKLKTQCRKKVKRLMTQISEQKQEANFQQMEIREEIQRLQEENGRCQANSKTSANTGVTRESDGVSIPGAEKMTLILELSEQVTEQNEKLSKLQQKLQEKNQTIEELRTKLRNNAEYIKARGDHDACIKIADQSGNNSKPNSGTRRGNKIIVQPTKTSVSSVKRALDVDKKDINSLFDVNDGEDETGSMVKLTSLLQGVKATNDKVRISSDSLDGVDHNQNVGKGDRRSFSGTSRDSGLGSASKRGWKTEKTKSEIYSEWKEPSFSLESELSDSDWERDSTSHSKISSAPPKLSAGEASKHKKKSNSLKNRASSKKREPSLAFVDSEDRVSLDGTASIVNRHHLSPILSTVDIS